MISSRHIMNIQYIYTTFVYNLTDATLRYDWPWNDVTINDVYMIYLTKPPNIAHFLTPQTRAEVTWILPKICEEKLLHGSSFSFSNAPRMDW